ncbi:MAG: type IV-A pilus assembly ATPase PilB [Candidatus Polarisedimenticolaceae bacterium]|nr:type IV-A pilus assembly ATPase PilB [Candidatus Polarisedimenticolaceae bacterium]
MATIKTNVNLSGLARCLIQEKLLSEDETTQAFAASLTDKQPFATYLVTKKILKSDEIAVAASKGFGVPIFDLEAMDRDLLPKDVVSEKLILAHHMLPLFKRGNRLFLAVSDPTNHQGLDEIRFNTGMATESVLVKDDALVQLIEDVLEAQDTSMTDLLDADLDNLDISGGDDEPSDEGDLDIDDAPVVRFVNKILLDAINLGASDIHLEPYEYKFRIRYRQDGMLSEVASPPNNLASRLTARIKVMSRMNIAERRVPQDGRIKMKLSKNRSIDFRVNTCPTLYGEKIVLRILDPASAQIGIEALGFAAEQEEAFLAAIKKPYGMILVTGPTGSGKTVTLYTALNLLNKPEVNISTVEDPVEIQVAGINQVNQNARTGMTFAEALRAFLRQDPDVVMVGEIRDLETAEIAIKAAQTGHLVLSTLHTNDAPQTLTRLSNMGIPAFNIASSVMLIIAQRLARRLCSHCKKVEEGLPNEVLKDEGFTEKDIKAGITIYKPVGCDLCNDGYKGRVGIFQVMPISEKMSKIIMENGNSLQLGEQAEIEGISDLRKSGLRKVMEGVTGLEEINRVTKD